MPTIHDLPNEVFLHIFLIGCNERPHKERNINCRLHPFITPVRSVCSTWRAICSRKSIVKRFFHTCVHLGWNDDSVPYEFVLDFSKYRSTLLTSLKDSNLFVTLDFACTLPPEWDIIRLKIHALDLAFDHAERIQDIEVQLLHPELVQHFAMQLLNLSDHQSSLMWRITMYLDHWESFASPAVSPSLEVLKFNSAPKQRVDLFGVVPWLVVNTLDQVSGLQITTQIPLDLDLLRPCQNMTTLRLHTYCRDLDEGEEQTRRFTLPFVRSLTLSGISPTDISRMFLAIQLPRLHTLTALDMSAIYPLLEVWELPTSLEEFRCQAYPFTDTMDQISELKDRYSVIPISYVRTFIHEFRCGLDITMTPPTYPRNGTDWRLEVSADRKSADKICLVLQCLKDTFEDTLSSSDRGVWGAEIEGFIEEMNASLQ